MNRISIIGTGYVGLVSGTCLSEFGLDVLCMDNDGEKIEKLRKGIIPIYEPGLDVLVEKNVKMGRLSFSTDIKEAVQNSTAIFIAVGTPPNEDGSADLSHVLSAAKSIAQHMDSYKVIVDKSTVPVGTGRMVKDIISAVLKKRGLDIPFDVVSNPEFLREGAAINDFMRPDRIIIGADSERAREIMKNIYRVLFLNNHPMLFTSLETAELIKYASNAFLATKIAFVNELTELCEKVGADIQDISRGMGMDGRIGKYFLHAGPGYGGSCFPKDTSALYNTARENDVELKIVGSVIIANQDQKLRMVKKISQALGGVRNKKIGILGLAFKPETDDIRDSAAITIIKELVAEGAKIKAFDPNAVETAKKFALNGLDIEYAENEYKVAEGEDALCLITEWNQFRNLDLKRIKELMRGDIFIDLRNVYDKKTVEEYGLKFIGVGKAEKGADTLI